MHDYWLVQYILSAIGWGYMIVTLIVIGLAGWLAKTRQGKISATLVVLAIASIFPILGINEYRQQRQAADDYKARYAKAKALFDERCKTAGEKIYRTVDGVEGVFLMKMRSAHVNFADQYALDDPYGQENPRGEDYVRSFLDGRMDAYWLTDKNTKDAFDFVEISEGNSQKIIQYRLKKLFADNNSEKLQLQFVGALKKSTSYGVDWNDESSREDRDNWIACGSVSAIDLNSKEILGKRTGCIFDVGLGNTQGERSPWAYARDTACPAPRRTSDGRAKFDPIDRNFIEKILKPIKGK
jgi:hypothetical protein